MCIFNSMYIKVYDCDYIGDNIFFIIMLAQTCCHVTSVTFLSDLSRWTNHNRCDYNIQTVVLIS